MPQHTGRRNHVGHLPSIGSHAKRVACAKVEQQQSYLRAFYSHWLLSFTYWIFGPNRAVIHKISNG